MVWPSFLVVRIASRQTGQDFDCSGLGGARSMRHIPELTRERGRNSRISEAPANVVAAIAPSARLVGVYLMVSMKIVHGV
jgi:hypothetical protein